MRKIEISTQPKSDSSAGLTISLKDETAATEKWREGVMENFGGSTLRGEEEEEEEDEVEIKWKMASFTKNALCQSWKRIDKGKRKKERKERMK